ncbi:hypothetical protein GC169_02345 [bacterium]|nr:hypothetical protein [bacterium]
MLSSTELASYVAARVLHDVASPLQALMLGGPSVLESAQELGDPMLTAQAGMLMQSVHDLEAKLKFLRYALGSQALSDGASDLSDMETVLRAAATASKVRLEWEIGAPGPGAQHMRVLLNMAGILLDPARNGLLHVSSAMTGSGQELRAEARGAAHSLKPDVLAVLEGRAPVDGWSGTAVQPYFTRLLAGESGLAVMHQRTAESVVLVARPV